MDCKNQRRARRIVSILKKSQPQAIVELNHATAFELLVATILSAQCTDKQVNSVTPFLFTKYPGVKELAQAKPHELEVLIRSTGFFRNKANNLIGCCQALLKHFKGEVPQTMEELTSLPGIGRKTANVILGTFFNEPAVIVDTHVRRVANRLQFSRSSNPTQIEFDIQGLLTKQGWTSGSQKLLLHGRYVCLAKNPKCGECVIYSDCSWKGKN